jgi:LacI family transcriptional regulator
MKRKVTLKQIAKELDVSISTVSKSLRNSHEIGEETRLKVPNYTITNLTILPSV